ncbi:MAG TPA: squalene/phytoene synthase family protein [Xanthobacteraceae bacterium]|nr:squalene/phytoene synthase family protein [Xanthobacteraceae bacterium]
MNDAFAYCAELVREADRDRYLTALFAPAEQRGALYGLYAFNAEVRRVRDAAREPLPGEIRLQWWTDVLEGGRREEAKANPVAAALLAAIEQHHLAAGVLLDLIEAHRFDLYDEPMTNLAALEAYARRTSSAVFALATQILGGEAAAAAESAGMAETVTRLVQAFPLHAARGQLYVPEEVLDRHKVTPHEVFAGRSSPRLNAALGDMRELARRHLAAAGGHIAVLPPAALPAFLPLAPLRASLGRLERSDAFAPAELPPWRRQWLIWRAARNPARIRA